MKSIVYFALLALLSILVTVNADVKETKIVGGSIASAGQFPYQVAFIFTSRGSDYYNGQFCGGSLITSQWVLTAGHCFRDLSSGTSNVDTTTTQVNAFIGENDLYLPTSGETIGITQIVVHPTYSYNVDPASQVDLCLVKLTRVSTFGTPVTVASAANEAAGIENPGLYGIVSGWGSLTADSNPSDGAIYPSSLYYVSIPLVALTTCQALAPFTISSDYLCAGVSGKDSCQGDSGGALVMPSTTGKIQVGVVSSGTATSQPLCPGVYGIYTRVEPYRTWMEGYTGTLPTLDFVYESASVAPSIRYSIPVMIVAIIYCFFLLL